MKKIHVSAVLSLCLLSACATPAPNLTSVKENRISIPVERIVVNEAGKTSLKPENYNEVVWTTAYIPLSDSGPIPVSIPPFSEVMRNNLASRFVAAGAKEAGTLEITPERSTVYTKARIADSLPLVGVFSGLSPRGYMCQTVVNFEYQGKTALKEFNVKDVRPGLWGDMETAEKADFLENCIDQLLKEVADFSAEFVQPQENPENPNKS